MACESLFQIVAASLAPDEITRLCQKHQIALPQASHGTIALYHLTHRQCHRDAPLARQIQRDLTRRYATAIARLNACPPAEARQMVEAMLRADSPTLPADIAGIIWAVASDPRPGMRAVEQALVEELHLLSHCVLLAQWRGEIMVAGIAQSTVSTQRATVEHTLAQLSAERQALQTSLTHLQQQTTTLTQDNDHLRRQLHELTASYAALQQRVADPLPRTPECSQMPHECRKLHYAVTKLTACVAEQEAEIQRLQALVASYEKRLAPPSEEAPTPTRPPLLSSAPLSPVFHGTKIAVIGGLSGATAHYEQTIAVLGGQCVLHSGDLGQGQKRLAEVIRQADIVLCPVDCSSHGAVASAKKLCKVLHKPCYFLRSAGVSHLREKLLEIAQQL
jgi:regulator of replication initiation timing